MGYNKVNMALSYSVYIISSFLSITVLVLLWEAFQLRAENTASADDMKTNSIWILTYG